MKRFKHSQVVPIVSRVDNAIVWIHLYPVDSAVRFVNTYLLDSDLSKRYLPYLSRVFVCLPRGFWVDLKRISWFLLPSLFVTNTLSRGKYVGKWTKFNRLNLYE